MGRTIHLYILIGAWGDQENDGTDVLAISDEIDEPIRKMDSIALNRAADYQQFGEETEENIQDRSYEISDSDGRFARFYVIERDVALSSMTAGDIFRNEDNLFKMEDAKDHISQMYEDKEEHIPAWLYEYAVSSDKVLRRITDEVYASEDSNVAYNDTLDDAVCIVLGGIDLTDEVLLALWDKFGDTPVNDDDEIQEDFMDFLAGTDRIEVWHWFDEHTPRGIAEFLENKDVRYGKEDK